MSKEKISYLIKLEREDEEPYDISMCNSKDCKQPCLRKNFKYLKERFVSVAKLQNSCSDYKKD